MSIEVPKQVMAFAGVTDLDSFEKMMTEQSEDPAASEDLGALADAETTFSETSTAYVVEAAFEKAELSDADMSVTKQGDSVSFAMANEQEDSESTDDEMLEGVDQGEVSMTVSCPGTGTDFEASGKGAVAEQLDENTVEFTAPFMTDSAFSADSSIDATTAAAVPNVVGSSNVPLLIGLGVGAAGLLGVGAVVMRRWKDRFEDSAATADQPSADEAHAAADADTVPAAEPAVSTS